MQLLRRIAVGSTAIAITIGVTGLAVPAQAAPPSAPPSGRAAPVSPQLTSPKAHQFVARTKSGDLVVYADGRQEAALKQAAVAAGGSVVAARSDRVEVTLPADKVATLAAQPGVTDVRPPDRAIPMGNIDPEGVHASGADAWTAAGGKQGDGVKVGIIDPGFGGLADAQAVGALPTGSTLTTNTATCADGGQSTSHGTSIAEIVHAMAPNAQLYLACAGTSMEFGPAATWLQQQGVQVITAALGFLTSGRGDGTGVPGSPADVVRTLSQAGILWSISAGNLAMEHYNGTATTAADGFVTYAGLPNEANQFNLSPGVTATVGLRWDAWPTTNQEFDLYISTSPTPPKSPTDPGVVFASNNQQKAPGGGDPTVETTVTNPVSGAVTSYYVYIKNVNATQTDRLDLFVNGTCNSTNANCNDLQFRTTGGSITEPATSPYAMAVGAAKAGPDSLESFSGQGPTIDGRMKPDIIGYDGVTTAEWPNGSFGGTSAGAANVAGAAALLKSQFPTLDAVRLRSELIARVNPAHSDNAWGNGGLYLGLPSTQPVTAGAGYTAIDPSIRVDGHFQGPNTVQQTTFPVPTDATAVEVTVTARSAPEQNNNVDAPSEVDLFPTDPSASGSRATAVPVATGGAGNFNSVNMVLTLGPDHGVRIRTGGGWVWTAIDLRGYFSPSGGSTYFPMVTPARVLDTRGLANTPKSGPLNSGDVVALPIRGANGVPSTATAAAISVTTLESSGETAVDVYAGQNAGVTLVTAHPGVRRTNTAIVPIAQDGTIHVVNQPNNATTQVIVDVTGWFAPGAGGRYVPLPQPTRVVDTGTGTGGRHTVLGSGEVAGLQIGGQAGIPLDASAAVLTTTAKEDNADTELSVYPDESGFTPATSLAVKRDETEATTLLPGLGASGKLDVRSEQGQAGLAIDAWGYFTGGQQVAANTTDCVEPAGEVGFTEAFDGRYESDLDGWRSTGTKATAPAPGCVIQTGIGNTDVTWYAQHQLGNDYTLRLDWKTNTANANSSVLVGFGNPGTDSTAPGSVAVQIAPGGTGNQATGAITGIQAPSGTPTVKPLGQWNTFEITVSWNSVVVSLNGTQVNGYTTPNPSALAANTYLGIRNSGGGDPVQYRDIRIRRNEPVSSGQVGGAGGNCLDLANDDITALTLRTWTCNGTPAQTGVRAGDGTLSLAGRCLDASSGTGNGSAVGLAPCSGSLSQEWVQRVDGVFIGAASGRCLTASGATSNASLSLQDCSAGLTATQVWTLPAQHGLVGELTGPGGRCLDLSNNDPTQINLRMWDCNRSPAQQWVSIGDGTLRVDGKCLDSGGTAAGTGVPDMPCAAGASTQQWVAQPDGSLINPASGMCLTAASGDQGAAIVINTCAGTALQQWHLAAQTLVRGQLVGIGGKCVDVKNDAASSGSVWLWDCTGQNGEFWNTNGDGTLQAFGECMDTGATGNGSGLTLAACSGSATQQWDAQPDGYLYNVGSGRVLDDQFGNTGNGTSLQIYDGLGNPNQKWSTPLRASLDGS
ncbi:MAG TPA: ricin-type beta-trefoil lectin domain protein [Pseudonocardiaceae bacterium]|jgi:hypothetical protein|nr:ricin-type beta-trefoil lectin domain protein [Pseudonocardiaceae bacterium]